MLKKISGLLVISLLLLLCGCPTVQQETKSGDNGNTTTNLAVETIKWVNDTDNYCQFYTNDTLYSGLNGTTPYYLTNQETVMTSVTTDTIKKSGNSKYSYGIIFCATENTLETSVDKKYDFFAVTVYTDKNYRIAKRVLGDWTIIQAKKSNDFLYNVTDGVNRIKVVNNGSGNFTLSFNGHEAAGETISFTDNTPTAATRPLTGGYYGYIAEIGKEESFPNIPVDVRFKQITP